MPRNGGHITASIHGVVRIDEVKLRYVLDLKCILALGNVSQTRHIAISADSVIEIEFNGNVWTEHLA